jgi:putative ABC transport system permease protein
MVVGDDYFATMGMPLSSGRPFDEHDDRSATRVVIVNETLARLLWPGTDPIGRRLSLNGPNGPWQEVVGVVRDAKYLFLWEDPRPMLMQPLRQEVPYGATLQVASDGDPAALTGAVRAAIGELDPDLPLYDVKTLERHLRDGNAFGPLQLAADLASLFGVLGLVLATVGLYGVLAYSVSQRTHEIGVRIALGAARGRIIRLVIRHGLLLCVLGLALGTVLAAWLTGPISALLVGVDPGDPRVYVTTAAVLLGVALLACYVPARRALRVDPVSALRAE